jgi:chemotaxis protein CheX
MNVAYVNPFITSTMNTFQTMMNTVVNPGRPVLKKEPFPSYDISGIIGLSGDAQGCIAISFPKVMALKLVSKMLNIEIKVVGPELTDGIGELANIIAGGAKQYLNGLNLSISLPNVVIGKDHTLFSQRNVPTIVVPFSSVLGAYAMEVTLKTK